MARVKKAYKRTELVHRFIHTPDYMYDKDRGNYEVSCYKNVLVKGHVGLKGFTNWEASGDAKISWIDAVALINREHKYIIISTEYQPNCLEVRSAVPSDYKVFFSNRKLSDWHITSTGELEEVLKLHTEYCVDEYYRHNLVFFENLISNNNKLDWNRANFTDIIICGIGSRRRINKHTITYLRNTYKIQKYSWYKEDYNTDYKQWSYKHSSYITRPKLSADKVYRDKVFTASEKLKLYKQYQWTSKCYGEGISYNKYWEADGKPFSVEALKKFNKDFVNYDLSEYPNKTLLDALNNCLSIKKARDTAAFNHNCELSKQNYEKALIELKSRLNNKDLILNWMNGANSKAPIIEVNYWGFTVKSYYKKTGKWENKTARSYSSFDTVQLRINRIHKCVETSKNAVVPLTDAISLYRLYVKLTKNEYPKEDTTIRLEDRNFKVGIYNLRGMYYKTKVTDEGRVLDYKEWCIVVGCHHIWMDDFRTFMNHFKLNNLFER
ncbi:MAG: hypothetical protein MJ209_00260 [archaeon]|nr:hypothetical protein [archaeon]